MESVVTSVSAALPYHEPDVITILVFLSFILLLNLVNHVLDGLIFCGLLGQILLGVAWGTPGGSLLGLDAERTVVTLGYLGLLLMVYEGGLSTSFRSLKANLLLSVGVAITGISLPIALAYVLLPLLGATPLQAFAAGAALCSTSLGTTFTVIATSGLAATRMGVVLTTAAMLDDVVGLVMVQVISSLRASTGQFSPALVLRPVFVSLGFGIVVPLTARWVVLPVTRWIYQRRSSNPSGRMSKLVGLEAAAPAVHVALFFGLITAASFAGTSNLFAAYLAGASVSWWDSEVGHQPMRHPSREIQASGSDRSGEVQDNGLGGDAGAVGASSDDSVLTVSRGLKGAEVFEQYCSPLLERILKPFFFASIGFSIPITRMFSGTVVWKGAIFTILMFLAKFACSAWLIRIPGLSTQIFGTKKGSSKARGQKIAQDLSRLAGSSASAQSTSATLTFPTLNNSEEGSIPHVTSEHDQTTPTRTRPTPSKANSSRRRNTVNPVVKPLSVYPGFLVGCAMAARGEIGFLISSLAEANGIFGDEPNSQIFLVTTWAILLCTVLGPLFVGLLVKRVRHLEKTAPNISRGGKNRVLGVWGVE